MKHDPRAFEQTLGQAVGDEPVLIAELRDAFVSGARGHLVALEAAGDLAGWRDAAARLNGLAASFGALALMRVAGAAAAAPCGDAKALAAVRAEVEALG